MDFQSLQIWLTTKLSNFALAYGIHHSRNMTQKQRWMLRYKEVMEFMEKNYRKSSRYRVEEHNYL